jgi:HEPN domain-containing protein
MQPSALAEAREWLARADEDLAAAKRLTQTPPPLLGIASYHAQQAAENVGAQIIPPGRAEMFR